MTPLDLTHGDTGTGGWRALDTVEGALRRHVRGLLSSLPDTGGYREVRTYLGDLLSGTPFAFAVSASAGHLRAVRRGRVDPSSSGRLFREWFVAVTACPWPEPSQLPRRLGGYLGLLAGLTAPAYRPAEGRHVAHWVVFAAEEPRVRLTLIPNHRTTGAPLILPRELLAPDERELLGLEAKVAS